MKTVCFKGAGEPTGRNVPHIFLGLRGLNYTATVTKRMLLGVGLSLATIRTTDRLVIHYKNAHIHLYTQCLAYTHRYLLTLYTRLPSFHVFKLRTTTSHCQDLVVMVVCVLATTFFFFSDVNSFHH